MISVQIDLTRLSRALHYMSEQQRAWAVSDALNRAMDGMYTTAKRSIPKQANVAQKDVTAALTKIPATRGSFVAKVQATERWLPASYSRFRAVQSATGAAFTPWKKREVIAGGFIATMRSGHTSIFKRVKPTQRRVGENRKALPIVDVGWGPNIAREMVRADQPAAEAINVTAQMRFVTRFESNYDRVVMAAKARFGL